MSCISDQGYEVLTSDAATLTVEALKKAAPASERQLHTEIRTEGGTFTLQVSVQTLGLELKRSRQNELLEVKMLRCFINRLRKEHRANSAAA